MPVGKGSIKFDWGDEELRRQFVAMKKKYKNKARVRAIAKPAAKIAVDYLRKGAIERGDTAKHTPPSYFKPKRRRTKGGMAVYHQGNARRSMRAISFRKSYFMHVGAKVNKAGQAAGEFSSGNKVEGYYNYFLQYGTSRMSARRHMSAAIQDARDAVEERLKKDMNRDLTGVALATRR